MLNITVDFPKVEIDAKKISRRLRIAVLALFRDALLAYVAASEQNIPVLTGQAKGVLLAIINELGLVYSLDFTPNSPYAYEMVGTMTRREYLMSRGQSPEAGAGYTKVIYNDTGDDFSFEADWEGFRGVKNWNYFAKWEVEKWDSIPAGIVAMENFLNTVDLSDYIPELFDETSFFIQGQEVII